MPTVKDYVTGHGGNKVIESILIANNGIAAVKCIRSMRKWAYETFGNERAIQFVVMATPEDLRVNAEYIRMADQIAEVPGGRNSNNYANVDLIVDIAERMGVQGVWAGWGHASENPRLPETLSKTNIAFLGPPAGPMRDLGDKIASTLIAQSSQVSCVPWNGEGITVDYENDGVPEALYKKATVQTSEEAHQVIERIGFPVMIKASEGGGGKGIRKVTQKEEIDSAFRQVQGEVPGSPIFIMKMITKGRHLEVQILGDQYKEAIPLYGRECSVQRRHQKIIEEGHAIIAPPDVWDAMERAAVRITKAVGYVGVGTVEYLFEEETSKYYFLELNPRLQVEHPVTELITNVNLVAAQLQVAMGIPLHRIPDIRRLYGEDPLADSSIHFETTKRLPPKGHVIAVRITGENPADGFKPTSGGIQELSFRSNAKVWGYFSVGNLGGLHEFADSQFGHIFAHGDNREDTRKELAIALRELSIRGEISTPIEYVRQLLETDVFKNNQVNTQWLDGLIANKTKLEDHLDPWLVIICGSAFTAHSIAVERFAQYAAVLDRGQIPPRDLLYLVDDFELIYLNTKYRLRAVRSAPMTFVISLQGQTNSVVAEVRPLGDKGLFVFVDGKSHVCYGQETASGLKLMVDGKTCQFANEYDPTQLRTTTAGKLVRYLVENGTHVTPNTPYAEMEVMKMYLPMLTTEAGVISHSKVEGSVLEPGDIIATVLLDDPQKVQRANLFQGEMPTMRPPNQRGEKVHQLLREAVSCARSTLAGYHNDDTTQVVQDIFTHLFDPELPLLEFQECLSQLSGRLPKEVDDKVEEELSKYRSGMKSGASFSGVAIKTIIDDYASTLPAARKNEFLLSVDSLVQLSIKFEQGLQRQAEDMVISFLKDYLDVEKLYQQSRSREYLLANLRVEHKSNLRKVYETEISHANLPQKNKLIVWLLDRTVLSDVSVQRLTYLLNELAALDGNRQPVVLKSKQIMSKLERPSFEQRYVSMERALGNDIEVLITESAAIFDVMTSFFHHSDSKIRWKSVEAYVRRAYRAYDVLEFQSTETFATWIYSPRGSTESVDKKKAKSFMNDSPFLKRIMTDDNLTGMGDKPLDFEPDRDIEETNKGIMMLFSCEADSLKGFDTMLKEGIASGLFSKDYNNVLKLAFPAASVVKDGEEIAKFSKFFKSHQNELRAANVKRVTVLLTRREEFPCYYTFRERLDYQEHAIYRHIEPPMAYHMELRRLANFDVELWPTQNRQIHLYYAQEKNVSQATRYSRFFARAVIRGGHYERHLSSPPLYTISDTEGVVSEAENVLAEACNALELAATDKRFDSAWNNHIFMKFVPEVAFDPEEVVPIIENLARKYEKRLSLLRVGEVELVGKLKGPHPNARFIITNPTTFRFNVDAYAEVKDLKIRRICLASLFGSHALDGRDILEPYPVPPKLERKRHMAHQQMTSYAYDFIPLLEAALLKNWEEFMKVHKDAKLPRQGIVAKELVLTPEGKLAEVSRPPGENTIGMVAWRIKLFTPECPKGRSIVLIVNDITFQIGSFGVLEDELFKLASELARKEGLPRIYVAANSGARIGLATEVRDKFQVEWNDPSQPDKGFKHLYVDDDEYRKLSTSGSLKAKKMEDGRWLITDIIGATDGLGVENLQGSGMIAGETSQAYSEIFTLTIVTGRTVGIGSYLVRLGQRTIQNRGPIILTGAGALNKVLGRKVYASNVQLGGTQIMFANGISHQMVNDELEGVTSLLSWLSYVPAKRGDPVPIVPTVDPVDRPIEFTPSKLPYDPRHMLAGHMTSECQWVSGFFDKDSFTETLGGWGKTVVTGRARLGGIPVGVIAVETRTVERVQPADPAAMDSRENVTQQAGQVWYPDSAYKTSQAIADFNNGEELPLIIFANWRGFSGGLRDLFDEILKFGSYIVDNLRVYRQPVFVYIPPFAELRGGAWVVVDPTINPQMMEMYADTDARGGVLEPNGIVEIKYKEAEVLKTMHRIDPQLLQWDSQLLQKNLSEVERKTLMTSIADREANLKPIYEQVAVAFADLHDTPGRMQAKKVIREVVPWREARCYFYFRLRRRLFEEYNIRSLRRADPNLSHAAAKNMIKESWEKTKGDWNSDDAVGEWLAKEDSLAPALQQVRANHASALTHAAVAVDPMATIEAFVTALRAAAPELRSAALERLKKDS